VLELEVVLGAVDLVVVEVGGGEHVIHELAFLATKTNNENKSKSFILLLIILTFF